MRPRSGSKNFVFFSSYNFQFVHYTVLKIKIIFALLNKYNNHFVCYVFGKKNYSKIKGAIQ